MEQLLCAFLQSKVTDMLQEQDTCMLKVTVLNVEAVEQKALVPMPIANITLHNSYKILCEATMLHIFCKHKICISLKKYYSH